MSTPQSRDVILLVLFAFLGSAIGYAQQAPSSCVACHTSRDFFSDEEIRSVRSDLLGAHTQAEVFCHDCHGGNPDPALSENMDSAMDPLYQDNPYRGVPTTRQVPEFCGRCHSDPDYMRRFQPDARIDQVEEFWTSQHGLALLTGDEEVATCISCHGSHGILSTSHPDSSVYPTRVAETCDRCHGDSGLMADRRLPNGDPLPIDQYQKWRQSVHGAALLDKNDLVAPTCNDCHGNHGAAPPGLDSIAFVCGQCHGREASIFRESGKRHGFDTHNEYLDEVGEEGCVACHDAMPTASQKVHEFNECTTCHGNHGIPRPTVAMFGTLPETPCAFCHELPDNHTDPSTFSAASFQAYLVQRDALLAQAEADGLSGIQVFDWLADRARERPQHIVGNAESDLESAQLRQEFETLFRKFRIGKSYYTVVDPTSGSTTRVDVTRCDHCHQSNDDAQGPTTGSGNSAQIVDRMRELTALTAQAERAILRARRGGVETRDSLLDVERAIDAQISLEVLVHAFSVTEESSFMDQYQSGVDYAIQALEGGQEALEELERRRRGLGISIVLIVLVLIALGLKIRQISDG